ncbi:hypothetical protein KPL76_10055 [Subtercola sp. PAMC28395]|uniref:hypothetical protein n=1 Tax=Subtercola sp. PAMC28395 TaxID=2846775 RepID=UPI001C0AA903|nr:hypothetical protein [Subtercola sp. PAMC28395]QWT23094.1 hypothetical protein KPL76_10055 [Subtercola sp. PAMC28395]
MASVIAAVFAGFQARHARRSADAQIAAIRLENDAEIYVLIDIVPPPVKIQPQPSTGGAKAKYSGAPRIDMSLLERSLDRSIREFGKAGPEIVLTAVNRGKRAATSMVLIIETSRDITTTDIGRLKPDEEREIRRFNTSGPSEVSEFVKSIQADATWSAASGEQRKADIPVIPRAQL